MAGTRTRKTEEERNEERENIAERQKNEKLEEERIRITNEIQAQMTRIQNEKNKEQYEERRDKNDDNKVYEEGSLHTKDVFSQFTGESKKRLKRGQLKEEAREMERDNIRKERQYKSMIPRHVKTNIASTISLAEMREVLKGPRAPALLLSDEEDEARRSGVYDPPPPPRARTARLSTLWETLRESERDSGDRL